MTRFLFSAALGAGSALVLGASAVAAGPNYVPDEKAVVRISVTDAELHTPAGAKELALRVRVAADHVCGVDASPMARQSSAFWRCQQTAIDHAIANLNAPLVFAALGRSSVVLAHAGP